MSWTLKQETPICPIHGQIQKLYWNGQIGSSPECWDCAVEKIRSFMDQYLTLTPKDWQPLFNHIIQEQQ